MPSVTSPHAQALFAEPSTAMALDGNSEESAWS
jgi:hypothetical protein